jgi:hypothetical protein
VQWAGPPASRLAPLSYRASVGSGCCSPSVHTRSYRLPQAPPQPPSTIRPRSPLRPKSPPPLVGAPLTPMSFRSTVTSVSLPSSASSPCLALPSSARPHPVTFPHWKSPLRQSERSCVAVPNAIESTSTTG